MLLSTSAKTAASIIAERDFSSVPKEILFSMVSENKKLSCGT